MQQKVGVLAICVPKPVRIVVCCVCNSILRKTIVSVWICGVKLAFHDADTDTDILAKILADTSGTRDFLKLFLWQAERHVDIFATILARMPARMSVSVSVSASWNASYMQCGGNNLCVQRLACRAISAYAELIVNRTVNTKSKGTFTLRTDPRIVETVRALFLSVS